MYEKHEYYMDIIKRIHSDFLDLFVEEVCVDPVKQRTYDELGDFFVFEQLDHNYLLNGLYVTLKALVRFQDKIKKESWNVEKN